MAAIVHVEVYEATIARAFVPGGFIWRETNSLRRENDLMAAIKAPVRTGRLRASIDSEMTVSRPFHSGYSVFTDSDYAPFVLGGTTGPIRSSRPGGLMRMRPAPHSWFAFPTLHATVRGQASNNFLGESIVTTFARNRLIG